MFGLKKNKVFVSYPLLFQSFVHPDLAVASPVILRRSFLQLIEITGLKSGAIGRRDCQLVWHQKVSTFMGSLVVLLLLQPLIGQGWAAGGHGGLLQEEVGRSG